MTECNYYQNLLQSKMDEKLTLTDQEDLALHLEQCTECRQMEKDLQSLQEVLSDWPEPVIPVDMVSSVMDQIELLPAPSVKVPRWVWGIGFAAAYLMGALMVGLAGYLIWYYRPSVDTLRDLWEVSVIWVKEYAIVCRISLYDLYGQLAQTLSREGLYLVPGFYLAQISLFLFCLVVITWRKPKGFYLWSV